MKVLILTAYIIIFVPSLVSAQLFSIGCGTIGDSGIYDIKDLARDSSSPWRLNITNTNLSLEINVCRKIDTCQGDKTSSWARLHNNTNNSCAATLTNDTSPVYTLVQGNNQDSEILIVNYTSSGLPCYETGKNTTDAFYEILMFVECNKSVSSSKAVPVITSVDDKRCKFMLRIQAETGCPIFNFSTFFKFIEVYKPLFAIGFILLGTIIGVFGKPMWKGILFILMAFTIISFLTIFMYEIVLPLNSPEWSLWLVFFFSILIGVVTSFYGAKYDWVGFVVLGIWIGMTFTIVLDKIYIRAIICLALVYKLWRVNRVMGIILGVGMLVIPMIYSFFPNQITMWVSFLGTAALCAIVAFYIQELLIELTTSLIGAYIAIRGLSLVLGGFPSEFELYHQKVQGSFELPAAFTIYLFLILILTVLFILAQEYFYPDSKKKSDSLMEEPTEG